MTKKVDRPILLPADSYRYLLHTIKRQERLLRILAEAYSHAWSDNIVEEAVEEARLLLSEDSIGEAIPVE